MGKEGKEGNAKETEEKKIIIRKHLSSVFRFLPKQYFTHEKLKAHRSVRGERLVSLHKHTVLIIFHLLCLDSLPTIVKAPFFLVLCAHPNNSHLALLCILCSLTSILCCPVACFFVLFVLLVLLHLLLLVLLFLAVLVLLICECNVRKGEVK